jgi:hypothetical protein
VKGQPFRTKGVGYWYGAQCSSIYKNLYPNMTSVSVLVVSMLRSTLSTRCDNLIHGMTLWKHNLLIYALAAAVLVIWWCHCWERYLKIMSGIPHIAFDVRNVSSSLSLQGMF